jgi:hypothetical protein
MNMDIMLIGIACVVAAVVLSTLAVWWIDKL